MRIEGRTVILRTDNRFFSAEKDGSKPYTIRIMSSKEFHDLTNTSLDTIRIEHAYSLDEEPFMRPLLGIFRLGEVLGKVLVGLHWEAD